MATIHEICQEAGIVHSAVQRFGNRPGAGRGRETVQMSLIALAWAMAYSERDGPGDSGKVVDELERAKEEIDKALRFYRDG